MWSQGGETKTLDTETGLADYNKNQSLILARL